MQSLPGVLAGRTLQIPLLNAQTGGGEGRADGVRVVPDDVEVDRASPPRVEVPDAASPLSPTPALNPEEIRA